MRHPLTTVLLGAAVLLSGNIAWGHGSRLELAAQRFEKDARAMQHHLSHYYGRSHLTRTARLLARQARHYRQVISSRQPAWRIDHEFAELQRCFRHFRHDWHARPVAHGGGGLEHAAVHLRRSFRGLRRAQREAGIGGRSDAWRAAW